MRKKKDWFTEISDNARPARMTSIAGEGQVVKRKAVLELLEVERSRLETCRNFFSIRAA